MKRAATAQFRAVRAEIALEREPENEKKPLGYTFTGVDSLNVPLKGIVPFENLDESRVRLEYAGIKLNTLKAVYPKLNFTIGNNLPNRNELAALAEQLGEQIEIGISPFQVCSVLSKTSTNDVLKAALADASERLQRGKHLHEAFEAQVTKSGKPIFPITFIYALKIGSDIGALEDPEKEKSAGATFVMLRFFAEAQKKADEIFKQIKKAMIYPICVMVAVFLAFLVEVIWIIPMFANIFKGLLSGKNDSLPFLTQAMLDISEFCRTPLGILTIVAVVAGVVGLFWYFFRHPRGIEIREIYALDLPVFGGFYRDYHASVFCRNLSMMWEGEPNIAKRFETLAETCTNPRFRQMSLHINNQLITQSPAIPDLFTGHYYLLGNEFRSVAETIGTTGNGQKQLYSYAKVLESRASEKLESTVAILQQVSILVPAAFVILLLLASYLPLFELVGRLATNAK